MIMASDLADLLTKDYRLTQLESEAIRIICIHFDFIIAGDTLALGGINASEHTVSTVESFDMRTRRWTYLPNNIAQANYVFATVTLTPSRAHADTQIDNFV